MSGLIEIGTPIKLGKHSDPDYYASNIYKCELKIADLIPVRFKVALADLLDDAKGFPVTYEFGEARSEFNRKLQAVGLSSGLGCRMWLSHETSGSDSISNEFVSNKISDSLNSFVHDNEIASMMRTLSSTFTGSKFGSGVSKVAPSTGLKVVANMVADGKHAYLPKLWHQSSYSTSLTLVSTLVSPYGSKRSIKKHIIEPMASLVCLGAASSNDGITSGNPPYVLCKAYGLSYMILGYISDISITRGGGDMMVNKWHQPLSITISVTVQQASDGFAAMVDGDVGSIGDAMSPPPSSFGKGPVVATVGQMILSMCPSEETCGSNSNPQLDWLQSSGTGSGSKGSSSASNSVSSALGGL